MSTSSDDKLLVHNTKAINSQARKSLLKPNPHLESAVKSSAANNLPAITISDLQGQFLAIQCKLIGAKSVLEIGTLGGYSTIWFASTGAKVTSIEINPKHRDVALENVKDYKDQVDIILGAALDVLPKLAEEGKKFDFVFIDADWPHQWEYFDWAVKLTRANGCIYVDNVVREMLSADELDGTGARDWSEALVTKVGKDERVTATLINTLSDHKSKTSQMMDGFLLAIVQGQK